MTDAKNKTVLDRPTKEQVVGDCYMPFSTMVANGDGAKALEVYMSAVREALIDDKLCHKLINNTFDDMFLGAFQDRVEVYGLRNSTYSIDDRIKVQKMRQKADNHLINVIRGMNDINRPNINIAVMQADQVNIADKQVNLT